MTVFYLKVVESYSKDQCNVNWNNTTNNGCQIKKIPDHDKESAKIPHYFLQHVSIVSHFPKSFN
jgi:hypothetical protein